LEALSAVVDEIFFFPGKENCLLLLLLLFLQLLLFREDPEAKPLDVARSAKSEEEVTIVALCIIVFLCVRVIG